ncbi:hypothetical protein MPH_07038 [Macrophomina phaseolina MS6]|uniref:Uncharacterized protein n=1 Tax=Macrophomina phaseolina (strain MS6) TaxID=1126212 RepID=K2RLP5_MACPH|nr:hypothetical protein MPH_07038 [Macrophomina phaseolina MS6]
MMNKTFKVEAPQPTSALVSAPATDVQPSTSGDPGGEGSRLPGPLKDPHLQGLSGSSQFYLYYCKPPSSVGTELSRSYVVYDDDSGNPFRYIVRLTPQCEAFRQVVIANAAMGAFRKSQASKMENRGPFLPVASAQTAPDRRGLNLLHHPVTEPYQDALVAKQRAIQLLARAIEQGTLSTDTVFGCILLFIYLGFLNSDQNELRIHLQAFRDILQNPTLTTFAKAKATWIFRNGPSTDIIL